MSALRLALRNLLRNRRRSLATLLAMVVGATAILVFGGYSNYITYGLQTGYVQNSGHLQIQHRDYFLFGSGNPTAYGIANYDAIIASIRRDPVLAPMVLVATPTLQLGGIAGNYSAGVSRTVFASGMVINDQDKMLKWNDYGFASKRRDAALLGTAEDAVVVGNGVARVLQLCAPLHVANCPATTSAPAVHAAAAAAPSDIALLTAQEAGAPAAAPGTRIEMLVASALGAPNVASMNVTRAVDFGVKELDDSLVTMHLSQAQHLLYGADAPQATAILVQLAHTAQMPEARARLAQLLATEYPQMPLQILDFQTLNPFYGQSVGMFRALFGFIAVLIGVIVLFTIGNTMSTAVLERTVEIGTLRAIGLRRAGIRRIFVYEGLLLGAAGAVLGVIAALLVAYGINHAGLTWLPPGRVEPVSLTVRVWGDTGLIVGCAVGLLVVSTLSALWPANRAAKMVVVDALRHV